MIPIRNRPPRTLMQFIVNLLLLLQQRFAAASHFRNDTIISTRDDAMMDSSRDHAVRPLKAPNLESARVRGSHDEKVIDDGKHDEAGCE